MRITRRDPSSARFQRLQEDLSRAAHTDDAKGRVCSENCTIICTRCGSTACRCACSDACPEASRVMSSDVDQPIESGVAPLVFEMKRIGLFMPCWSCEGHLGPTGALWKLPRVWFYCDSLTHIRLLADGVKDLELQGDLTTRWQVVVTFSDPDNIETTFSLEPVAPSVDDSTVTLAGLQKDLHTLSRSLEAIMGEQARKLQRKTEKTRAKYS